MSSLNWPRIGLCGLIVGAVFTLMTAVLVGTLGSEFLAAAGRHGADGSGTTKTGPVLYLVTVSAGLWAMWLYAVVRPHFESTLGAVATVSLAWWLITSVQSLKWILLLGIPLSAVLPLTANLIPIAIAVFVGSVAFGNVQLDQPRRPPPSAQRAR